MGRRLSTVWRVGVLCRIFGACIPRKKVVRSRNNRWAREVSVLAGRRTAGSAD